MGVRHTHTRRPLVSHGKAKPTPAEGCCWSCSRFCRRTASERRERPHHRRLERPSEQRGSPITGYRVQLATAPSSPCAVAPPGECPGAPNDVDVPTASRGRGRPRPVAGGRFTPTASSCPGGQHDDSAQHDHQSRRYIRDHQSSNRRFQCAHQCKPARRGAYTLYCPTTKTSTFRVTDNWFVRVFVEFGPWTGANGPAVHGQRLVRYPHSGAPAVTGSPSCPTL